MILIVDFQPVRLRRARAVVEKAHPGTASAPRPVDSATLAALRHTVAAAEGKEAALILLADRLSPRHVRGLVTGLERWEDLRDAVLFLLRRRASPRLLPLLWNSWQRSPTVSHIRHILSELGGQFGWDGAVASHYVSLAPEWVMSPETGITIQQWLDSQGLSFSHLDQLADSPVRADWPLGRLVRDAILTNGSRNQLHSEAKHLPEWHLELEPETRLLFGRNYLLNLPAELWDRTLLNRYRSTYGLPKKPRLPRFWEPIPEAVRERFQRIFIEEEIREAFSGDAEGDRQSFWRDWAGKIVDIERKNAGEVPYAFIEFEHFAVFDFFETGDAAYFYLPGDATRIGRRRPSSPRDLKEKKERTNEGYGFVMPDNRLIHNPPWGWHPRGKRMVQRWLRHLQ